MSKPWSSEIRSEMERRANIPPGSLEPWQRFTLIACDAFRTDAEDQELPGLVEKLKTFGIADEELQEFIVARKHPRRYT